MAGVSRSTVGALDAVLAKLSCYQEGAVKQRIRHDVLNMLQQAPSLRPTSGPLIHNNGTQSTLLNLTGTIPIIFRRAQYNIPVEIWILEQYPHYPPRCYVRPTSSMMVKPGHKHVDSSGFVYLPYLSEWTATSHSLLGLVGHLITVFGFDPPVYAKPPGAVAVQPPPVQQQQPPPQPYQYQQPPPSYQSTTPPPPPAYGAVSIPGNGYQAQNPPPPVPVPVPPTQAAQEESEEQKRSRLRGELTLKIQERLEGFYTGLRTEIDTQFDLQGKLTKSQDRAKEGLQELQQQAAQLQEHINTVQRKDGELEEALAKLDGNEPPPITELVKGADTWSQQALEAVATSWAVEDTLYHLDRALNNGSITLEEFLKETRRLSREQYMARVLTDKILENQRTISRGVY